MLFDKLFKQKPKKPSVADQLLSSERWLEVECFVNEHIDEISKFKMTIMSYGAIVIDYDITKCFTKPAYSTYEVVYFFEQRPGERELTDEERAIMESRLLTLLRNHGLSTVKDDLSLGDSYDWWHVVQRTPKYKNPY